MIDPLQNIEKKVVFKDERIGISYNRDKLYNVSKVIVMIHRN